MDFYWIVTLVAAILLILGLVIFGLMVKNVDPTGRSSSPSPNVCPDYWTVTDGSACVVPSPGSANTGILPYVMNNFQYSTDSDGRKTILFSDPVWKKASNFFKKDVPAECTLMAWSTTNHVLWDGITNNLKCAEYNMTDEIAKTTKAAPTTAAPTKAAA